jgi:guanidinopropionase
MTDMHYQPSHAEPHLDADFLDASVAPACHTPCVCGPDTYSTTKFFRAVRGLSVVGADVNELCPQYEPPLGPSPLALGHVAMWELELIESTRPRNT